ncbi:hypothetical protein AGMMS49545_17540 [Betaproteobacteria bacterium]|nr:hypothetical protein AGMMS49545_17540 [Betaproteobacteria bacterium]
MREFGVTPDLLHALKDFLTETRRAEVSAGEIIETHDLNFKTAYEAWSAAGENPADLDRFGLKPEDVYENPDCFEVRWALEATEVDHA